MKSTPEKIKKVIAKVFKDLELDCDKRYPIDCIFHQENDKKDKWLGGYDYREIGKYGEQFTGMYTDYIISIDDETGVAFARHHYAGHMQLLLDENGKYIYGKQLYRPR